MFLRNDSPPAPVIPWAQTTPRWRTQLTHLAPSKTLRLRSKCGRIKSLTRLRNRSFFVETLRSIATFRVSEEKFQISFWQRFFFLWLRFFLFGRSKKKEMNKTALCTKIFRSAQHDTSPPLVTLSTAKGLKPFYTKIFRLRSI